MQTRDPDEAEVNELPIRRAVTCDPGEALRGPNTVARLRWGGGGSGEGHCETLLDAEEILHRCLLQHLQGGARAWLLRDYDMQLIGNRCCRWGVVSRSWHCGCAESGASSPAELLSIGSPACALVLITASVSRKTPPHAWDAAREPQHVFILVASIDLVSHREGGRSPRLLQRFRASLPNCTSAWTPVMLRQATRQQAATLRKLCLAPHAIGSAPISLCNWTVLDSGASLPTLRHPWMPLCIKGYKG